jgi:hypothetical protein
MPPLSRATWSAALRGATIRAVPAFGPGLAKAYRGGAIDRSERVQVRAGVRLIQLRPSYLARLIEEGDVVSEGGLVDEAEGRVYYGSTSIRCRIDATCAAAAGPLGPSPPPALAALLACDPHLRLLVLRIARREAVVRAAAPLKVMYAELGVRVLSDADGIRLAFDVDLSAALARAAHLR